MEKTLSEIRKWLCLYPFNINWMNIQIELSSKKNLSLYTICRVLEKFNKNYEIYEIVEDEDRNKIPRQFLGIYAGQIFLMKRKKNGLKFNGKTHEIEDIDPIILVNYHTQLKNNISTIIFFLLGLLFFTLITLPYIQDFFYLLFAVSILIGCIITAFTNFEFLFKNSFMNGFCDSSCKSIRSSKKWKVFSLINFNGASFSYFLSQLIFFYLYRIYDHKFILLLYIASNLSLFFIFISIIYQLFEAKICKLCMAVNLILLIQYLTLALNFDFYFNFDKNQIFYILLFFMCFILNYKFIKKCSITLNYVFNKKKSLITMKKTFNSLPPTYYITNTENVLPPKERIKKYKQDKKTQIFIYTNLICEHCQILNNLINDIVEKFENVQISYAYHIDLKESSDNFIMLHKKLIYIYLQEGFDKFKQVQNEIYDSNYSYIRNYEYEPSQIQERKIVSILKNSSKWASSNSITFAPFITINNHVLTGLYNHDLLYDIIENIILNEN